MRELRQAARHYHTWVHDSTRWQRVVPRAGDIVIGTQSKCGTTWMQRIVSLLVFQSPAACNLVQLSPWIDCRFAAPMDSVLALIEAQTHRRFFKSHLPFDGLPMQLVEAATFEAMKRDAAGLLGPAHLVFDGGTDRFFFQGSNNRWKAQVSADHLELADKLAARFSPGLRRWIEHGRGIAGDPVTAAD